MDKQIKVREAYELHGYNVKNVEIGDHVFINDKIGIVQKTENKGNVRGFNFVKITLTNGQIINIFKR